MKRRSFLELLSIAPAAPLLGKELLAPKALPIGHEQWLNAYAYRWPEDTVHLVHLGGGWSAEVKLTKSGIYARKVRSVPNGTVVGIDNVSGLIEINPT